MTHEGGKGVKKTVKVVLIVVIALAVLAAGMLVYCKFFVTPLDKTGMVYKSTEQVSDQTDPEE